MAHEKEENIPAVDPDENISEERRGFLIKSGALLAALGLAGLTEEGSAFAQDKTMMRMSTDEAKTLKTTLESAMKSGDIQKALESDGRALPADVKAILGKLTASDLRAAASLNSKLAGLKSKLAEGNNGYVGM
jgi:hypothetical protein